MARIVYGVSGEGSGHSSRAREMASHLREQGHTLKLVSYDRGYKNLKEDFDVFETEGLCIASEDNRVSIVRRLRRTSSGCPRVSPPSAIRHEVFKELQPDCVITIRAYDGLSGQQLTTALITIDNLHRMRYVRYEKAASLGDGCQATRRSFAPRSPARRSLVTAFCFGETKNERSSCFRRFCGEPF